MMEHALEYISQGFKVFSYCKRWKNPIDEERLKKNATEIQPGVKEYWGKWPDANIGLSTQGLVVIDFDVKNNGTSKQVPS